MKSTHSFNQLFLSPDYIFLDIENPRFMGDKDSPSLEDRGLDDAWAQEEVRRYLIKKYAVRSLVESILRMGFLPLDKIVVRPVGDEKYVVVEGNRRVAAIKTILGDAKRKAIDPPARILTSLESIQVLELVSESQNEKTVSMLLQGVRHISGVKSWGPYQQGRLIHTLVSQEDMKLSEAALAVGLSPSRVGVLLRSYCGMQQMLDDSDFGHLADPSMFSYFEHAYLKLPVREWLGWDDNAGLFQNGDSLRFFYRCIIPENGSTPPLLLARDVRDLLPVVLENEKAFQAFESGKATIAEAYSITRSGRDSLDPFLQSASKLLQQTKKGSLPVSLQEEDVQLLEKIHALTGQLLQHSEHLCHSKSSL